MPLQTRVRDAAIGQIALSFTLVLAIHLTAQAQNQTPKKPLTQVTSGTMVEGWQTGDVLSSLVRIGFANKIPLGIVLEGDSLCNNSVPGSSDAISVGTLIDQVQAQDPDYVVEIQKGILYVHPKAIKASTLDVLGLEIPRFTSKASSAQEMGISLWMFIRGVLVPQETSMFSGGLQRDAEKLPAIDLSHATVDDILDRIIASGEGGVWILYEVPPGQQSNPLYEILSYSGDQGAAGLIKCRKGGN
jgi:hypothetical protein